MNIDFSGFFFSCLVPALFFGVRSFELDLAKGKEYIAAVNSMGLFKNFLSNFFVFEGNEGKASKFFYTKTNKY